MLIDWIWALLATLGITLEAVGWGRLFSWIFFPEVYRQKLSLELWTALGLAITAQCYFILSLTSRGGSPQTHVVLMVAGLTGLALTRRKSITRRATDPSPLSLSLSLSPSPRPRLRLARFLSPLIWKRLGLWLALPVLWAALHLTDALLPNNYSGALAIHLFAPHRWLTAGTQLIDPLHPASALASVWDALYYHAIALLSWATPTSRHALIRGQITAQLLHFVCGQVLCLALCARLIQPLVRAGWNRLVHSDTVSPAEIARRHRLGTASTVAGSASLLFAWIACAQAGGTPTYAMADWGSAMLVFAALIFFLKPTKASAFFGLGWFIWATAFSSKFIEGQTFFPLLVVCGYVISRDESLLNATRPQRAHVFMNRWLASVVGLILGLVPWSWRNLTQTGQVFFPYVGATQGRPGWLFITQPLHSFELAWGAGIVALLLLGLLALAFFCVKHRFRLSDPTLTALVLFALVGEASRYIFGDLTLPLAITAVLLAALGLEYALTAAASTGAGAPYARWYPYLWFFIGLVCVAIPIHLVWQNLPWAFRSSDDYLGEYHAHFQAKLWSNLHLARGARIAWTADNQFYYLEAESAVTHESTILHDALLRDSNPAERARTLCELGFDIIAWEDHRHGPEVAGLATWARLQGKSAVLYSDDELSLLDLHCQQFHLGT